ncbi:MAG: 50S ribosomal protein L37ae [Nanoarchaeota archaeon]|nr:50S ribosomal protein L37ae [Nanoarchaeota archaeon]MBU1643880.1 50S ribosomal protein L37ae [Nanoarchaeota archaeon]MBU1977209.1 50S ribosomal protein L37ae [Nanoarchaeota archaeon]
MSTKTSTKRFGPRYGRSLKNKFSLIETQQRAKHKCPYCNKDGVKRVALGIWQCRKCDSKFAGKAYSI